uniref:Mitochondrial fission process protein 1 n=1 Tax=Florenciella parvula TaxID=236787 RepID=A0A7S2CEJ7_9STRA|mmetsp:Transcript_27276/g.56074  ORF Transcript_27276/g.56074 Transcript_27276/m.56074 type:complete len:253 (+) Transcript_27276:166-924(+)|eukprot:CAMPEP_0182531620 /NCGR_PEP_ID=MMETSP1323-20130603/9490_1 /TAXON_ID=236787 /ORGANISM="Florenciella parvula, Strain RCC1693" /LENGTH=252 /DNA_ID=CAMNT_0024741211 /DNA_START=166 /DNA_END=924 /DNA_ORIENTATION=+
MATSTPPPPAWLSKLREKKGADAPPVVTPSGTTWERYDSEGRPLSRYAPKTAEEKKAEPEHNPMSDPNARYLAYLSRVKLMMARAAKVAAKTAKANVRYLAYSSDVGESARPIVPPWAVNAAYVVAIGYVAADVGYHGYLEKQRGNDDMCVARNTLQHATFQIIASLAIPTIIIHTAVHQSQNILKGMPKASPRLVMYGPSAVGLALIPFMPLFDPPVEHACEWAFEKAWPLPDHYIPPPAGAGHGGHEKKD